MLRLITVMNVVISRGHNQPLEPGRAPRDVQVRRVVLERVPGTDGERDLARIPDDHQGPGVNVLRGKVKRASFLGDSADCAGAVADSVVVLRVLTSAGQRRKVGEVVGLEIGPEACATLADGDDVL